MAWIAENWFLLLLLGGCMGMHLFMHGRGHGNHDHHTHQSRQDSHKGSGEPMPEFVPVKEESNRIPK